MTADDNNTYNEPRPETSADARASADQIRPLCVDLDGTLIQTDLLWESLFVLLGRRPLLIFLIPWWIMWGKARFKAKVAARVTIDAETLPYRQHVLDFVRQQKVKGRRLVLATASHQKLANCVATHLGLFDDVIATDANFNCRGVEKLQALEAILGNSGFDYIGDSKADFPIWREAVEALIVGRNQGVVAGLERIKTPSRVFECEREGLKAIIRLLRPHQWIKNTLLFLPIFLSHQLGNFSAIASALVGFVSLSLCASATYILNDLTDVSTDRRHPRKRTRPLAAGSISIPLALIACTTLLAMGIVGASVIGSSALAGMTALYVLLTTSYSYYFKRKLFADVLLLAGLYVFRILMGGVATGVPISEWLLAFSAFFFMSLAFAKRTCELRGTEEGQENPNRNYRVSDIALLGNLGPTCGYLAVLVLALYINDEASRELYISPSLLWLVCPLLLYWITRIWFLAHRDELDDDPVLFALKDPHSYLVGLLCGVVLILATTGLP